MDIRHNPTYYRMVNDAIENSAIASCLSRYGYAGVDMRDSACWIGSDLGSLFESEPEGKTDKYVWHTVRVDQLINLKISKCCGAIG